MARSSGKKKVARRKLPITRAQLALGGALLGLLGLGLLEPYLWFGALVRELGFQLALGGLLAALALFARKAWLPGALLLLFALLSAAPLFPLYRSTRPTPEAGPLLRVATADLAGVRLTPEQLGRWLAQARPDVLALTGLADVARFPPKLGSHRVLHGAPERRALLLVQSALAVAGRERADEPSVVVRAGRCQARVTVLALPPLYAHASLAARAREITRIRELPSAPRSIWLGQLGSRSEAHDLRDFIAQHGLRDARLAQGRLATAPGSWAFLGFPQSAVLVHGWISVREAAVQAPWLPGAQRPLSASLELTEPRCRDLSHARSAAPRRALGSAQALSQ